MKPYGYLNNGYSRKTAYTLSALPSCTPVRSGNMTTGENMTTKLLPYQTPAIGYKCLPGSFGPINATTSPPTCDRPVNTTETLASSSNTSVASTFAQCQNSYNHNQSTTTIDCLNMLGENIRGALATGETNITLLKLM